MIATLIRTAVTDLIEKDEWDEKQKEIENGRRLLGLVAEKWDDVSARLDGEETE